MDGNRIMRKFIVVCLMAAIGAVAFIQHANAGQNEDFCRDHSNWPGCPGANPQASPPVQGHRPPGGNGGNGGPPPPPPGGWHSNGGWHHQGPPVYNGPDTSFYFGLDTGEPPPPFGYRRYYYPGQCRNIAFDLRDQGFEHVRPIKCSGPRLVYSAWRDGEKLILYVSRDGRIRRILPAY